MFDTMIILLGNRDSHPIGFSDIRIAAEYNSNIKTFQTTQYEIHNNINYNYLGLFGNMTARTSLRSETRGPGQQQLDAPDAFLTLWARLQSPSALRFSSLREGRRRTRYHVVFLTILRFAIHHEWRSSILLRQQQQFHQLCFLDFSRTQLF